MKSIMQLKKLSNDQSGLVAIIVTMIIMFVLTITVISFATTSQRNARQSLDRQLNNQAYYAAESGINDALTIIKANLALGNSIPPKPNCDTTPASAYSSVPNTIDPIRNVSYTCLIVNPSPNELVYDKILTSHSQVIPIKTDPTAAYVALNWNSSSYVAPITGCASVLPASPGNFPASNMWPCNAAGVLRVDLVDMGLPPGDFTRTAAGRTKTFFIYPINSAAAGPVDVSAANGDIYPGTCSSPTPPVCSFKIALGGGLDPLHQYYLRIKPIYRDANLRIIAPDSFGARKPLTGAQATIDATGKAQDVLRRVQVHAALTNSIDFPDYAIQTTNSICKTLSLTNNTVSFTGPTPDCDPSL